jgi:hypothetical protein
MKKIILNSLMVALLFTGCNTDLDINKDPDFLEPEKASLSAQLAPAISGLAGSEGASLAIIGGIWAQYYTQSNASNQYKTIDNYTIGTSEYNFAWDGMYDALGDLRNVKRKALTDKNWKYYLIAVTLDAQATQILTDFYGNIPYKEANDLNILTPKFDSGEEIYDAMIQELNNALSKDLSTSVGEEPRKDDFIFEGDMDKWTAFANTMKLKIFMRQTSSSRANIAATGITQMINDGVSFLDEDASLKNFKDEINQSNPLFEFNNRRLNTAVNLRMSRTLSSYLIANSDPRRGKYYTSGNALNQGDFNNPVGASTIALLDNKPVTPVLFLSREESLFLQAEAMERYNGGSGAKALYDEAIKENFKRYSPDELTKIDPTTLIAGAYNYPAGGTLEEKIEAIITQKWIASFPGNGFEGFFEKNRTGYPKTSAVPQSNASYVPGQITYSVTGQTGGLFPKRIVYPLSERNANPNAPALVPITTNVWWNKN